jgi:protein farnesyltransferase/geranylgeranyltransferase type-1 subunit alpha
LLGPRNESYTDCCLSSYTKDKISLAPNNAAAWNFLRGTLDHNQIPYSDLSPFVLPYTLPHSSQDESASEEVLDLENPLPSKGAQLPCPEAIEFIADMYEAEGGDSILKATEVKSFE